MKTIKILSRHETVAEAVQASDFDISYNPDVAKRRIIDLDRGYRGAKAIEAFVTPGKVFFLFKANDDVVILNEFNPFTSVLDNRPFSIVEIDRENLEIRFSEAIHEKSEATRSFARKNGIILG